MSTLEAARGKGAIFIMGAMGSGTTLLRLVLDSHDNIAIPPETGFMRAYKAHRFVPFKWTGRDWAQRLGWSDEELDAELSGLYDRLFRRYAEAHGKQRWGEKTPLHIWHIDAIARLFPDAVFVAIARHPGASMASNMNRWRYGLSRATSHFDRVPPELLRQAAHYPDRTVLLRYEELLLQPEPVLRELLDWLGEPWSDRVLEHHVVQADRGGEEVVEGRNRVSDPLDLSRIGRWQRTSDATTRVALERRLGRLPEFLGYSMLDAAVLDPLNDRGSLVTGGRGIKRRFKTYGELGLNVRGNVPWFEQLYHPRDFTLQAVETVPRESEATDQRRTVRRIGRPIVRALPAPVRRRFGGLQREMAVEDRARELSG